MKKKLIIASFILTTLVVLISCNSKREPGRIYMPDMVYSRAYETYAEHDSALFIDDMRDPADWGHKIFYNSKPVTGTIRRGDLFPYTIANDSNGYKMSASVVNPLPALNQVDSLETGRLFNIYCGVCHGASGQANGPVSAKLGGIKNLTSDEIVKLADGTIFHSITYGKNNMGSYASQLNSRQRWMIVQYVRTLQKMPAPASATTSTTATRMAATTPDSTKTKKP